MSTPDWARLEALHLALEIEPDNAIFHMRLAAILWRKDKGCEAFKHFRESHRLGNAQTAKELVEIAKLEPIFSQKACSLAALAIELDETCGQAHLLAGDNAKQPEKAVLHYRRARVLGCGPSEHKMKKIEALAAKKAQAQPRRLTVWIAPVAVFGFLFVVSSTSHPAGRGDVI